MYRSVHSNGDCDAFQQDLDSIAVWCSKWQMCLNVSKCDLLRISNKRTPTKPSYHINNYNNLHWVSYVKYLGFFMDKCFYIRKHKIKVPIGCVEADLTLKLSKGQNLQLTAAESVTGHHYQPGECISA